MHAGEMLILMVADLHDRQQHFDRMRGEAGDEYREILALSNNYGLTGERLGREGGA
jgi:hypothetical protein